MITLLFQSFIIFIVVIATFSDATKPSKPPRSRRHHKKLHKHGLNHLQLYGVSLSSITGFEKPMIPPNIVNFDIPINYERPPIEPDTFTLDLPTKEEFLANNRTNPVTTPIPLQQK